MILIVHILLGSNWFVFLRAFSREVSSYVFYTACPDMHFYYSQTERVPLSIV